MADKLGWILVHSSKVYDNSEEFDSPQQELESFYPGMLWFWKRSRAMKENGPYTLLFALKGEIFGRGTAHMKRKTWSDDALDYNFAFELNDYVKNERTVALADVGVYRCRDLVKLTPERFDAYMKLVTRM